MPELPEVETTKRGLQKEVVGLFMRDVWTDLNSKHLSKKETIANKKYFPYFKKHILNKKILSIERRAKNILINLSGGKILLVHMKMTGYLFYGEDPKIKYAHVVFFLSNKKYLVFSDMRKFGKITLLDKGHNYFKNIGPEPLDTRFTLKAFHERILKRQNGKIKTILMDQTIIAGIGNIYSDEILWRTGVHPERKAGSLTSPELRKMLEVMKKTLKKGIDFGGDSMSDYRNIYGKKGRFQLHHEAYRRTGEKCRKPGCKGKITRKVIGGRSAHFCLIHQK